MATISVNIGKNFDVAAGEKALATLADSKEKYAVRIVSNYGAKFFSDLWASILIGTICQRPELHHELFAWGLKQWSVQDNFHKSLPGITALQLSDAVRTEGDERFSISDVPFSSEMLDTTKSRHIVEFDPQRSVDPRLKSGNRKNYNDSFRELILDFRSHLEQGYKNRGVKVQDTGGHADLVTLMNELQENSYKYCREISPNLLRYKGLRVLKMRGHIAPRKQDLLERALGNSALYEHLESSLPQHGWCGVMEASISDFGLGIVDHFLSTPKGSRYAAIKRTTLLRRLVEEPLSSTTKLGSGYGLSNAIDAARGMKAFISLRTAEFWQAKSFAERAGVSLLDVQEANPPVAGTHWQFIWSMGL